MSVYGVSAARSYRPRFGPKTKEGPGLPTPLLNLLQHAFKIKQSRYVCFFVCLFFCVCLS